MRRDIETFTELCDALTEPKATLASACRAIGLSVSSAGRYLRASKLAPADNEFLWRDETAPLHTQARRASKIAYARWLAGERPSRPIRHREIVLDEVERDETADAPQGADMVQAVPVGPARHMQPGGAVHDAPAVPPVSPAAPVESLCRSGSPGPAQGETLLQRDLSERVEARARGKIMPPLNPVRVPAPSPRYISPEEKSEGIGAGRVREGGFKVQ